ncbi:MAG: hypothetical protein PVI97_12745 [Candidatus Thiodiazotropha sp.]|jgi:hypothetical protein
MELYPEKASVFRGGTDFTVKPNEVKIDKVTGLVKPTHGVSKPSNFGKMGGLANTIDSIRTQDNSPWQEARAF